MDHQMLHLSEGVSLPVQSLAACYEAAIGLDEVVGAAVQNVLGRALPTKLVEVIQESGDLMCDLRT
jgi:hypothetical protein